MKTIWFASTNKGKIKELKYLLSEYEIKSINDLEKPFEIEETGKTFQENAKLKAEALSKLKPKDLVLADDSGLCIKNLKNFPGVYSARWAHPLKDWKQIVDKLLEKMSDAMLHSFMQREAYFQSTLALIDPKTKTCYTFTGTIDGYISHQQLGKNGYAYDTVFIPTGSSKTFAEMEFEEKQAISHRQNAIKKLVSHLKKNHS